MFPGHSGGLLSSACGLHHTARFRKGEDLSLAWSLEQGLGVSACIPVRNIGVCVQLKKDREWHE